MIKVKYKSSRPAVSGWRYLWAKTVIGFDPNVHCARCLKGEYQRDIGLKMIPNEAVTLDIPEGMILYICGVSMPYIWKNNFHLVLRAKQGARTELPTYNGDTIAALHAERVMFTDEVARRNYPSLGKEYLTCRNFQFGAEFAMTLPVAQRVQRQVTHDLPGLVSTP